MTGKTRTCPHCGVSLPDDAAFCPFCAEHIRPRQTVKVPSHLWRKGLRYAAVLVAADAAGGCHIQLCDPQCV